MCFLKLKFKGLPALTRVTRLDSNFDPVPGSTVPRIAPSLLVYSTLPRQEEEVHVALPPLKSTSTITSNTDTSTRTGTPVQQTGGRRVACRELGEGDCQGWLHRRRHARGFLSGSRWNKRWFVLKKHTLYGFRDLEDQKAESMINLPHFSAALAPELKSKKFTFKVFNPVTTFYFACETKEELSKWMSYLSQTATAAYNTADSTSRDSSSSKGSVYYSETEDESLDEGEGSRTGSLGRRKGSSILSAVQKTPFRAATVGRIKKSSTSSPTSSPPPSQKSPLAASLDRKYLRFLRGGQEKQPVPTPQYRSYRKPPSVSSLVSPPPFLQEETARFYVNAKPPPRPPSKSKSPSPTKPSHTTQETAADDVFLQLQPAQTTSPRKTLARSQNVVESSESMADGQSAQGSVRKSVSTSKLGPGSRRGSDSSSSHGYENIRLQRRSLSRRHSIELSSVKKTSPITSNPKPQPTPRAANKPVTFNKSRSEPPFSNESGYAKIQPRRSGGDTTPKKAIHPSRTESTGRRSSLTSSRRSSGDANSSVKSSGTSSLPRSPLSPLSPSSISSSKSIFDFQPMESPREGPPDRLWISSLRNNPPPLAPKPRTPVKNPDAALLSPSAVGGRLKSAACYQPMNFPLSPSASQKDESKMKLAFEMVLDDPSSPGRDQGSSSNIKSPDATSKNIFKIFASPKFSRKSPSPAVENARKAEPSPLTTPKAPPPKTLLGSPRLHRAIFGSGREKRKKGDTSPGTIPEEPQDSSSTAGRSLPISPTYSNVENPAQASSRTLTPLHQRPVNRPPPLINPHSPGTTNFYEESESCPGTPRTPLKPAMGVSMIGKQRRTPVTNESFAFSPTQCPSPGLTSRTPPTLTSHFTYTVPVKSSPSLHPLSLAMEPNIGELEYPPVFEPGSYSLAERSGAIQGLVGSNHQGNLGNQSMVRSSPNMGRTGHPIPAPRTKFLINSAAGGCEQPTNKAQVQHVVRVDVEKTTADESNA